MCTERGFSVAMVY